MFEQPTVADYIVRRLTREGLTDCFGVAGDIAFKLCDAAARSLAVLPAYTISRFRLQDRLQALIEPWAARSPRWAGDRSVEQLAREENELLVGLLQLRSHAVNGTSSGTAR